jgi:hypothetical protein
MEKVKANYYWTLSKVFPLRIFTSKNLISVSTSAFDRFPIRKKFNGIDYSYVGVRGGTIVIMFSH